jgi:hypothetical protein
MTKRYKVHYTADIWEVVEIEADSKKEAEDKFLEGKYEEPGEEMGRENLKVDLIEEVK